MSAELESRLSALLRDNTAISKNRADNLVTAILAFVDADRARNEPTHPSPIPTQTPDEVPFIRQKAAPECRWVETTREALDAMEPRVRAVFDVRTLYTAPVEASAGDGLTVEQAINDAYPVACFSIGEVEDRTIELRGFRKGFAAALASHIKAGGQVGSGDAAK